jgi:hypothetical protein
MGRPWWEGEKKGQIRLDFSVALRGYGGGEFYFGDLGNFQPALTADAN